MPDTPHDLHPAAPHHMPAFITAPGETDVLMVIMGVILLFAVVGFGLVFLRLHTLPERIAHKSKKLQFEIVAVLGLISLFTHMHIFWVIGLLLALVELPDFGTPLGRIARSTEKIAGLPPDENVLEAPLVPDQDEHQAGRAIATAASSAGTAQGERDDAPAKPGNKSARSKEASHA